VTRIFYTFRDSPPRRNALAAPVGAPERYLLFGLDELRARGHDVRHNLERARPPAWAREAGRASRWGLERAGGYGGDFATVYASLGEAGRAEVVVSTVDTVGIPLLLLKRAGRLSPPLVYVAVGLPERLALLRGRRMRRLYASALARASTVVAYSEHEAEELERWVAAHGERARTAFVPFGVRTDVLVPATRRAELDVVSVGADPHRDYELLVRVAEAMPDRSFRLVAAADRLRSLTRLPRNVSVEVELAFEEMLERLRAARVVALPVRENSYSGATTVLLQAMALGKPVVVSRTQAISNGYGLVDGDNCRLVPPGDPETFARALRDVLGDDLRARALGGSARITVERELGWDRYVDRLEELILDAAATSARARPGRG